MAEYIEREKALNANFRIKYFFREGQLKTAKRAVWEYADYIASIPSADVRPVVHGEWITDPIDDSVLNCSACMMNRWSKDMFGYMVRKFRYCPNCGAKMAGDADGMEE